MGVRAGIIECPHCGNHLQDTRQEHIDCRFCGKRFKRGTVGKEKEEAMRRDMVMDLSDKIQKRKSVIFAGKVFGLLFIVMAVILLFSEEFNSLGSRERRILFEMAKNNLSRLNEIAKASGESLNVLGRYLEYLMKKGVIVRESRGSYRFVDPVFEAWIKQSG